LREPGFEYKATLESEVDAAVAGGVTSLACPPDTDPPLDEPGLVEMLKYRARSINKAHVYPVGALTQRLAGESLTEMSQLAEAGCVAFSQAEQPLVDTQVLLRALQYAATFGHRVWLRPQEPHLARGGVAHDGEVATRLGLPAIPTCAETIALATIFALTRSAMGSPSRATSPFTTCICATSTSAGSTRNVGCRRRFAVRAIARRCALRRLTARSTSSAPITRPSTTTASSFRSAKPSPARRGSSCCCR
jgi:hypothetical protein